MRKTLLTAAVLGATVAAHAEQTTQVVYPYAMPFAYAPVQVDENLIKAYEQHLAYQGHVQANTPAFLRIPGIPRVPAFNSQSIQDVAAENERLRAAAQADSARRADALQQSMTMPAAEVEQLFAEREKELDATLAGMQQRLDERQKALDVTAKEAETF